jgi:uncharacterized protein
LLREYLPATLTYHNFKHTVGVLNAVQEIAKMENVTGEEDLTLLKTAALYHDSGFLNVYDHHEEEGCRIVRKVLPGFGYSTAQIDVICDMIMATMLPQSPKDLLEFILCDADLDHLGRDDFYTIGKGLHDEWYNIGRIHSEEEWNAIQISFLEKHRYWTNTSQRMRAPGQAKHLEELRQTLQQKS